MARLPDEVVVTDRVRVPARELSLSYARSGGPGGQHVNKTASKVVLRWNLERSDAVDETDRARLRERLGARLTTEGDLLVVSDVHRDQGRNVDDALGRFADLLRRALRRPKRRKKTRPTRASRERRLQEKRRRGERKSLRRRPPDA